MLFVNAFLRYELSAVIAGMFIMSMLTLAAALLTFLIESAHRDGQPLRIGIIEALPPRRLSGCDVQRRESGLKLDDDSPGRAALE